MFVVKINSIYLNTNSKINHFNRIINIYLVMLADRPSPLKIIFCFFVCILNLTVWLQWHAQIFEGGEYAFYIIKNKPSEI